MKQLGIGLVGSGFMGRAHALAFRTAPAIYDLPFRPCLEILADRDDATAKEAAASLGFARATANWRTLINDPRVDLISITAPNALHKPIALAALAAGKPVYCEKPLATTVEDAREMADAADASGLTNAVGFNYLQNPMIALARDIVQGGEIGEITGFRGIHAEGFMADPATPFNWRCEPEGGGALADLGSHIISFARHLVGGIDAVSGRLDTVHRQRPTNTGPREVQVDDQANAIVRFANGASGTLTASWITTGRTMQLAFELTGTRGALEFTQERFNELRLFKPGAPGRQGFTRIEAGPVHPDYARFCPAPGHQLGFNDLKTIEVARMLRALGGDGRVHADFREAYEVARVVDAIQRSSREERWITISH